MKRWITVLLAAATLSGCITTREVVYREPYRSDGYYADGSEYYPDERAPAPAYSREGGSYYSPSYGNRGDYYFGADSYGYGSFGVSYFDYPFYYSVFWPINRWYYDPFAYPGYYYGVTWFPRSYFSLSYSSGWHSHGWLSYSPYRYSWVDHYYDWGHWYDHYPSYRHYYPTPRYGDARVEASRLADIRRPYPSTHYPRDSYQDRPVSRYGEGVAPSYSGNRAAIGRNNGYGGYGKNAPVENVRRVGANAPRVEPSTGLFGNPVRSTNPMPRDRFNGGRPINDSRRELSNRYGSQDRMSQGYAPADRREGIGAPVRQAVPVRGMNLPPARTAPNAETPIRSRNPIDRSAPVREGIGAPVRPAVPVRGMNPAPVHTAPDEGIPIRGMHPYQRSAPVQRETDSSYRFSRDSEPVQRTMPARGLDSTPDRDYPSRGGWQQQAPSRGYNSNVERSEPAPMRAAPMPSQRFEAPARSAMPQVEAPRYSAPPSMPTARPAPSESRSEGVRRVGSDREE